MRRTANRYLPPSRRAVTALFLSCAVLVVAGFNAGVGYSIPGWAADAINGFLSFVTHYRLDRVGAFLKQDPPVTLFQGRTQAPGGCASSSAALVPLAPVFPAPVRPAPAPGNVRGQLVSRARGVV